MTLPLDAKFQVPQLTNHGFLPPGIYDCTLPELKFKFANLSQKRFELYVTFEAFLKELTPFVDDIESIIIDGQFISSFKETSDIDVLIIAKDANVELQIDPLADKIIRSGIDVKLCHSNDDYQQSFLELFSHFEPRKHKELSDQRVRKGFVRLSL